MLRYGQTASNDDMETKAIVEQNGNVELLVQSVTSSILEERKEEVALKPRKELLFSPSSRVGVRY